MRGWMTWSTSGGKVKRIEDLEAKVSSSAQSLLALQDDLAASRRAQDALDQERRLKLLETWRQEEVQQVLSRYDQRIESLTHKVATEELQKTFQPLTTEAKQLTEQVTVRVANLEEQVTQSQVSSRADAQELGKLKQELDQLGERITQGLDRCAEKEELAEVSRGLQTSVASAQETMQSVKAELLQVQKLAGVHQPKDEGSTPQPSTREAEDFSGRVQRLEAEDLAARVARLEAPSSETLRRLETVEAAQSSETLRRFETLEASAATMSQELQALLARIENIPKDSGKELQDTLHRLDRDVARQHARLDDLEHERREGQLLEEVLQDKVKRIEDLEAKVSSSAQSLLALQDDLAASRRAQDALDQERRLKLLETWRQEEVQQVFSRYDQKIESLTHRVATEELQKIFQPLTTEAKQLTEQVTMRVANLEEQVTQSQELAQLKQELGQLGERLTQGLERCAEKEELAEVSRGLQTSVASAQETMQSVKAELLQVQKLVGVHQPKDEGSTPQPSTREASLRKPGLSEPLPWSPRVADVARLAEELHHARSAAMHQTRLEVHRAEAVGALEAQVAALNLRIEDVFARLSEVELGIDTAGRGGVALRLRFEQMQSSVELRLTSLAGDVAEVCTRQHAMERGLRANEVREVPDRQERWRDKWAEPVARVMGYPPQN